MAAKATAIILLTDAPLGENRFPKGTSFSVVDKLPGQIGRGEIDRATAAAWKRSGWAEDVKAATKPARGGDGD